MTIYDEAFRILTAARKLIEDGWTQGHHHQVTEDGTHRYCATGAVHEAAYWTQCDGVGKTLALQLMALLTPCDAKARISAWNDDPSRTKEEVLGLFDTTIRAVQALEENVRLFVDAGER